MQDLNQLMIENPNIDESNISYIKKQYTMHWKQRLLSENIQLDSSLVFQCFFHFKRQFMQSIFPKENADKALKYRLYRHLPAYEKIIRKLVSFYRKKI